MNSPKQETGRALRKVMLVDDDPDILLLAQLGLESYGLEVVSCDSGNAALQKFADAQPDLIVLDLMMPEMDGIETLHRLRDLPGGNQVKIVFLTAKGPNAQASLRRQDCAAVVSKPFSPTQIGDTLLRIWEE